MYCICFLAFCFQVWTVSSGFCFVTFTEHTNAVTALHFTANNNTLLSASLDGTVRAWDLIRYRNFRTFTTPTPRQFVSLAADQSGEIICAGTSDNFEVLYFSCLYFSVEQTHCAQMKKKWEKTENVCWLEDYHINLVELVFCLMSSIMCYRSLFGR